MMMESILSVLAAPVKVLLGILGWVAIIVFVGLLHRQEDVDLP